MVVMVLVKKMAAERKWCPPCMQGKVRPGHVYFIIHQCRHGHSPKQSSITKTSGSTRQVLAREQVMRGVLQHKLLTGMQHGMWQMLISGQVL